MKNIFFVLSLALLLNGFANAQNWNWGVSVNPELTIYPLMFEHFTPPTHIYSVPGAGIMGGFEFSRRINARFSFLTGVHCGILGYGYRGRIVDNTPEGYRLISENTIFLNVTLPFGMRFETQKGFYSVLGIQFSPVIMNWEKHFARPEFNKSFNFPPGFHAEAGYRLKAGTNALYLGATFNGMLANFEFLYSAGIKASLFFNQNK